jgi:hypothetical protein
MPTEFYYSMSRGTLVSGIEMRSSMIVIVIWPVFQALKESYFGSSIGGIRTGANGKPRLDKDVQALMT